MIHFNRLFKLFAALLLVAATGCHIFHHAKRTCDPTASPPSADVCSSCRSCLKHESVGLVQTGGQFARRRVLPIALPD